MRMIAGLERPTSGEVVIAGEVVNDFPPRARNIAMVFQSYALYPHMTVGGNIAFPLKARGMPRDEIAKKVRWAAEMFHIGRLLERKPRQLARDELKQFQRQLATTSIYVTHDQVEAMGLGDRIAVLNEGKVRQIGTPQQIYDEPADTFVAPFIGSPPLNPIH